MLYEISSKLINYNADNDSDSYTMEGDYSHSNFERVVKYKYVYSTFCCI